ncbi:LacI family DNA-binding transcriptional regulator [Brevibacterium linens]|uniref:LacI family DNA-binding transcriptional regulator n=1 Tax=Brevibacterium linens TaxID=1703 RepID=UPI003BF5F495
MVGQRVTIVDIARELGISKSLVSNALHDRGRVSAATRQRVRTTAAAMGYVSNRAAQQLRSSRYGTIGLMIPSEVRALSFYMQVTMGVSEASADGGSDLMLYTQINEESRVSLDVPIDGAIVCDPIPEDPRIDQLARARVPVVTIGPTDDAQALQVAGTISIDFAQAVSQLFNRADQSNQAKAPALLMPVAPVVPVWLNNVRDSYRHECRIRGLEPREVPLPLDLAPEDRRHHANDPDRDGEAPLRAFVQSLLREEHSSWIVVFQGLASTLRALATELTNTSSLPPVVAFPSDPMSDALDSGIISIDFRARDYGRAAAELLGTVSERSGLSSTGLSCETPCLVETHSVMLL